MFNGAEILAIILFYNASTKFHSAFVKIESWWKNTPFRPTLVRSVCVRWLYLLLKNFIDLRVRIFVVPACKKGEILFTIKNLWLLCTLFTVKSLCFCAFLRKMDTVNQKCAKLLALCNISVPFKEIIVVMSCLGVCVFFLWQPLFIA